MTTNQEMWFEGITKAAKDFVESGHIKDAILSSTRASYANDGYSVELLPTGFWRVLWDGEIGNRYDSPGLILGINALDDEWDANEEVPDWAFDDPIAAFQAAFDELVAQLKK